ncbi:MAG: 4Fe-4S dicluster domain-containing protein [Planctomycetales bacterium]
MTDRRTTTAPGDAVALAKTDLQQVLDALRQAGYRTIGPRPSQGAIVFDDIERVEQLPIGMIDEQDGGRYRLRESDEAGWFDYVVGPHSLKNFLFPPRECVQELVQLDDGWECRTPPETGPPLAVIGVRGCDLHALAVQDRTFLEGPYVDPGYQARREKLFLVAVNCRRAAATCFCHSMQTGPAVRGGYDLALTELEDRFVVDIGTDRGAAVMDRVAWSECATEDLAQARALPADLERAMHARESEHGGPDEPRQRRMDPTGIRDLLLGNLEHPRWDDVAARCLGCTNCTMVCPTCFCSTVEEVADLSGEHVRRERAWASCFTEEHSYLASGVVRPTIRSQYRQWLTHKLASWIDQFGTSGCIGCGRCITWCPVGIDLTEEVAAIRGDAP